MAAIAPISILDGKSTPQTHVFNPKRTIPNAEYKRDGVAGLATVGWESFKIDVKPASNTGVNKVTVELAIPVMEVPAGGTSSGYTAPPGVAHVLRGKIELYLHNRSVDSDRKDLRVLLMNALANAQVIGAIESLEQPY